MQITPIGVQVSGRNVRKFYSRMANTMDGNTAAVKGAGKYEEIAKKVAGEKALDNADILALQKLGVSIGKSSGVMDAQFAPQVTASIPNPVQFLQTFAPGVVRIFQDPTVADELIGFTQIGFWEDAQIVQRVMEWVGFAREYGDVQTKPNASWLMNFVTRNPVRFEIGLEVQTLQERRAARGQVSDADEKRGAAAMIMNQILNNVAFFGYNSGNNATYGILNDPNLPSLTAVASTGTGSSPLWSTKTFLNITADLTEMHGALNSQTKGRVDSAGPEGVPTTLVIPNASWQYFNVMNVQGTQSVRQWYENNYPNSRIKQAPQMDLASGGTLNVMYLFADAIPDDPSSDDHSTFMQMIQTKWMALGTQPLIAGYKEGYSAATAGVLVKRPLAIVRRSSM